MMTGKKARISQHYICVDVAKRYKGTTGNNNSYLPTHMFLNLIIVHQMENLEVMRELS